MQEYISYLKGKIFDLEMKVDTLQDSLDNANPWVCSIVGDPICPYHHNKDQPPSPPSFGGAAYSEAGPSQFSQSQFY